MNVRRRIVIITAFLLLGAVVNVAVVWGLSLRSSTFEGLSRAPCDSESRWWRRNAPPAFAPAPSGAHEQTDFGRTRLLLYQNRADGAIGGNVGRFRAGWPARSLEGAIWVDRDAQAVHEQFIVRVPTDWPGYPRPIPWRPLWIGFAINSLIYGSIIMLSLYALLVLRRRIRRGRSLCENCAYPIGVSPVCTECGAALHTASSKSAVRSNPCLEERRSE